MFKTDEPHHHLPEAPTTTISEDKGLLMRAREGRERPLYMHEARRGHLQQLLNDPVMPASALISITSRKQQRGQTNS